MNELYFIDYEAKVMLSDTLGMRPDTELAHRRLCDVIWSTGEPPADDAEILQYIFRAKPQDYARIRGELMLKGWQSENGKFTHGGCVKTISRCKEKHDKRSAAGRAGNMARWAKTESQCDSDRNPTGVANAIRPESQSQSQSQSVKDNKAASPLNEFPEHLKTERIKGQWDAWMKYRRGLRKPGNWESLFNEQIKWLSKFDESAVLEILSTSIRQGYQGLFEPKNSVAAKVISAVKSTYDLKTQLDAINALMKRLEIHRSETASGIVWDNAAKRDEYRALKKKRDELNKQLAAR